jgi:hypothetical protein
MDFQIFSICHIQQEAPCWPKHPMGFSQHGTIVFSTSKVPKAVAKDQDRVERFRDIRKDACVAFAKPRRQSFQLGALSCLRKKKARPVESLDFPEAPAKEFENVADAL